MDKPSREGTLHWAKRTLEELKAEVLTADGKAKLDQALNDLEWRIKDSASRRRRKQGGQEAQATA